MKMEKRIQEIEDEIISVAHIEAKLSRFIRNGATPEQIAEARRMLADCDRKIFRLKTELKALDRFGHEMARRMKSILDMAPIDIDRPVTFFGIEEVQKCQAASL